MLPYQDKLNEKEIWNIAQNKPSLVVKDLKLFDVPEDITYSILLARGVFKWLACRRDIIKLKDRIKEEVKRTINLIREAKRLHSSPDYEEIAKLRLAYLRGYLKAKEEDRKIIRAICHSERFRAPDFDKKANEFLETLKLFDKSVKVE